MSNFHPDTGGKGSHLFRLTCSVVLWGGRNTANKYHWCVWGVLAVYGPHWVCPSSWSMCFPGLHCSGSRLLYRELSKAGPGFCALPRSKLLRFGFLGAPQRQTNLGMIFVPFPGLSSSGKKVFGKPTLPGGQCILSPPQSQLHGFLGVQPEHRLRCAMCLLSGADL